MVYLPVSTPGILSSPVDVLKSAVLLCQSTANCLPMEGPTRVQSATTVVPLPYPPQQNQLPGLWDILVLLFLDFLMRTFFQSLTPQVVINILIGH